MAAIGVFDVTKRTAFASVHNNTSGPIVAEFVPTKRTAFASVRYNTSGPIVAEFMPTKRTAFASIRNNTSCPIVASWLPSWAENLVKQVNAVVNPLGALLDPSSRPMPTLHKAFVRLVNRTSRPIVAVSVVHKFSEKIKDQHQWGIIPCGYSQDLMEVGFWTQILPPGYDWWLVTWYSEDMKTLYYSNPNNFRGLFDKLESWAPDLVAAAAGAGAGMLASPTGPGAIAAAVAAAAAAKATTSVLFNSESTEGFKMHTLLEEDANAETEIIIRDDGTITFKSNSDESSTVYASRPAPTPKK